MRLLGRTWYRRGTRYWLRRTGLACFYTLIAVLMFWIDIVLLTSIAASFHGSAWYAAVTIGCCVLAISVIVGFRSLRRSKHDKDMGYPMVINAYSSKGLTKSGRRRAGLFGGSTGGAAAAGSTAAGGLVLLGSVIFVGYAAAIAFSSFQRYLTRAEFEAVRQYGTKKHPKTPTP
ncbi:hypothetical protein [Gordonia jinhuaensis]|uniref:hypothetical protein n=1 Tax=Gordonia jinhuaensis TaxID=1517702 RepID=UPI001666C916|nr:hypothetical protein [Gordonia jinhuaensis]